MLMDARHSRPVEVIVIGGSAGAIEVLLAVLPALPAELPAPVVVVVHLPQGRPSLLPQIFAPRCALAVAEPEDKQPLAPGIWFAPPDYHLLVERDRTFSFSVDEPHRWSRPSIDVLFQTACEAVGPSLAAVVLTGANDDGAAGAAAIRAAGGLVLVQDPATAEATQMPLATIDAASPQVVFEPPALAGILRAVTRRDRR